jgi:Domain of unknown function (DUF4382)
MIRKNTLHLFLLLAAFSLTSCSGLPKGAGGGGGGGNGTATVSFTLVADTLPPNPSLLSFKVTILSITLTPTSGTVQTFTPASPIVVDLMRLQSDAAFLGSLANVPAGIYTVQISLAGSSIVFLNDTLSNITVGTTICPSNVVCSVPLTAIGTPTISSSSFTFTASSGGQQGLELDFNLNNAMTLTNGTLTVNFNPNTPNPGVFTAFNLPRQKANLGSGQLELIEDFTGVVSLNGNNVTITSPTRGALTAAIVSGTTFFDQSPAPSTLCANAPSTTSCAAAGQIASVDAFLKSDGTLSLKEFEPITSKQQDLVEGIVISRGAGTNQFNMVVTDENQAASGSLIGGLTIGQLLTVNIPAPLPFFVDTKGLAVPPANIGLFEGASDTSIIFRGQAIAVNVTAFTPATNNVIASATATTVILRWSRFTAGISNTSTSQVNINALPSYFGALSGAVFGTEVFTGSLGGPGVTNLDGVTDAGNLNSASPVALRALFLENSSGNAPLPFMAAKIRQQ